MLGLIAMITLSRWLQTLLMTWLGLSYTFAFIISLLLGLTVLWLFGRWYGQREAAQSVEKTESSDNEE
jgi:membrane protein implicated in regulation of membrane protease activity